MRILWIKIRLMRICWCMITVQPNTLVNFKNFFFIIIFLKFYFAADFYAICTHVLFYRSVSDCQQTAVDRSKIQNENQIRIHYKTGLQILRIRICEKVTESVGFKIGFEIRHIPSFNRFLVY